MLFLKSILLVGTQPNTSNYINYTLFQKLRFNTTTCNQRFLYYNIKFQIKKEMIKVSKVFQYLAPN